MRKATNSEIRAHTLALYPPSSQVRVTVAVPPDTERSLQGDDDAPVGDDHRLVGATDDACQRPEAPACEHCRVLSAGHVLQPSGTPGIELGRPDRGDLVVGQPVPLSEILLT